MPKPGNDHGQAHQDPPAPRAAAPKGFRDYFGAEVTERAEMLSRIAQVYHAYGFDALESSAVETVEALGKFLPDVDRTPPTKGCSPGRRTRGIGWPCAMI